MFTRKTIVGKRMSCFRTPLSLTITATAMACCVLSVSSATAALYTATPANSTYRYNVNVTAAASILDITTAIPEPSTLSLAALGLFGLIGCGRRRKRESTVNRH